MWFTSLRGVHIINLPHDPFRPLDACVNQLICSGTSLWCPEQVVCRLHVQARKNRCHDSDQPFSTFIHWRHRAPDRTSRNRTQLLRSEPTKILDSPMEMASGMTLRKVEKRV